MTTRKLTHFALLLACLTFSGTAKQLKPEQKEIEAHYAKAAKAAELKYVDGLTASRAPEFRIYTPAGEQIDLALENQRFALILSKATRIRLVTVVRDIKVTGNIAELLIDQTMKLESFDENAKDLQTKVIHSVAVDVWYKSGSNWKLALTKLQEIRTTTEGKLPIETRWKSGKALPQK